MDDIQILREMLTPDVQVTLQSGQGRSSVQLTDLQSGTTVEIKGLPPDSIVIRAEDFENPLTIFIGKSFWESEEFLDGYEYRFISIVDLNFNKSRRRTQPFYSTGELHDHPNVFLKISQRPTIYFRNLINPVP